MTDHHGLHCARLSVGSGWGRIHPRRWSALVDGTDPGLHTFLDVGCASGDYVTALRAASYKAWGLDALQHDTWAASHFLVCDGGSIGVKDNAATTAFAFEVLEHVDDPIEFLVELRRVASRRVVLSVPNCHVPEALRRSGVTYHHWVDPTHRHYFDAATLATALLQAGLHVEQITSFNPVRTEYLALRGLGMGARLGDRVARLLERNPWRREFHMTLLASARVV